MHKITDRANLLEMISFIVTIKAKYDNIFNGICYVRFARKTFCISSFHQDKYKYFFEYIYTSDQKYFKHVQRLEVVVDTLLKLP